MYTAIHSIGDAPRNRPSLREPLCRHLHMRKPRERRTTMQMQARNSVPGQVHVQLQGPSRTIPTMLPRHTEQGLLSKSKQVQIILLCGVVVRGRCINVGQSSFDAIEVTHQVPLPSCGQGPSTDGSWMLWGRAPNGMPSSATHAIRVGLLYWVPQNSEACYLARCEAVRRCSNSLIQRCMRL